MEGRLLYAIRNTQYTLRFVHHISRFTFHLLILLLIASLTFAAQTPIFTDVTTEAGINFKHTNGRGGEFYFVEQLGSGAAFFDYDNDEDLDLYFVNGADLPGFQSAKPPTNRLYRNDGDGTFTDVTELAGVGDKGYGVGCCVGDYDNDGHLDLYVTNFGKNRLYRNNGDGTFTDIADRANVGDVRWGASCAFADYDNDGHLDLYVTNYIQYQLDKNKICENKGVRTYCNPQEYVGEADILYRSNGDGTYTEVTQAAGVYQPRSRGLGIVWGDYDSDGYIDLYVANDTNENHLFHNNGDGSFSDMAFFAGVALNENGEMGAAWALTLGIITMMVAWILWLLIFRTKWQPYTIMMEMVFSLTLLIILAQAKAPTHLWGGVSVSSTMITTVPRIYLSPTDISSAMLRSSPLKQLTRRSITFSGI